MTKELKLSQEFWDELEAAHRSAKRAVPPVVAKYRELGTLTWALLHKMEDEVMADLEASEEHPRSTLRMIRSSPLFRYPKDDSPVSFGNSNAIPVIFGQIEKLWKFVH